MKRKASAWSLPEPFPHLQAYVDFGLILGSGSKNVSHNIKNQKHGSQVDTEHVNAPSLSPPQTDLMQESSLNPLVNVVNVVFYQSHGRERNLWV